MWTSRASSAAAYALDLGGNVHDLLIALNHRARSLPPTTLDRRRSTLAAQDTVQDTVSSALRASVEAEERAQGTAA